MLHFAYLDQDMVDETGETAGSKPRPFEVVSLMELLEASAEAWWHISSLLGQLIIRLETSLPPPEQVGPMLAELHSECSRLDLPFSRAQIDRIKETIPARGMAYLSGDFRRDVTELHIRIMDELKNRFYLIIPEINIKYYKQDASLFGSEVEKKFPLASEDISEAGKCLALGRYTACVFHLMRAMESALPIIGAAHGITVCDKDGQELTWGKLVANLNTKTASMPVGQEKVKWQDAGLLLFNVGKAWRNSTMHPKQTYTGEEAVTAFNAVRDFMVTLSSLV